MWGLPSIPYGLHPARTIEWLGSVLSDVPLASGDTLSRPTADGYGDPGRLGSITQLGRWTGSLAARPYCRGQRNAAANAST